jgi:Nucleolar protein,Nop52
MHDSKNALSVQTLIATLAGTLTTMYEKDLARRADLNSADGSGYDLGSDGAKRSEEQFPWLTRWTRAFWETISREWSGIDQWRMNKYLSLVRYVVRETFTILYSASRDETEAADYASLLNSQEEVLETFPLSARERKVPDGLRLHVLDIWMEELMRAEREDGEKEETEEEKQPSSHVAKDLMKPIQRLAENSISKSVKKKAKEIIKVQDSEETE